MKAYDRMLDLLADRLRKQPMTAREIAEHFKCCKPAAYQRLRALRARGEAIYTLTEPAGARPGPRSTVYGIQRR